MNKILSKDKNPQEYGIKALIVNREILENTVFE
jgi:hypothetical protein